MKESICDNFVELIDHLRLGLNQHMDYLFQERVLYMAEYDYIRAPHRGDEKSQKTRELVLKILKKNRQEHIMKFVQSLQQH